jgi:ATP-dependent DNA ligase
MRAELRRMKLNRRRHVFEAICAQDLEGIVAKRKNGIYKNEGKEWMKIKNPNYSQAKEGTNG